MHNNNKTVYIRFEFNFIMISKYLKQVLKDNVVMYMY